MAKNTWNRVCILCGKEFVAYHHSTILCSEECKKIRHRSKMRERANRRYHERKAEEEKWAEDALAREKAKEQQKKKPAPVYGRKDTGWTLAQINAEARKRGMTYGQYMEYLYFH